ncbi:MAG: hypothetical protein ACKV22_05140 [Bryobacteraceae bacterium]
MKTHIVNGKVTGNQKRRGRCAVCRHARREEIETELARGALSGAEIERQYGVAAWTVWRHGREHLKPAVVEMASREGEAKDQRLLERLRQFEEVTDAIVSETREKKPEVAIRAMARGEKQIQMERWLAPVKKGEHAEWWKNEELVEQNRVILETLKRHPAALREVMAALRGPKEKAA